MSPELAQTFSPELEIAYTNLGRHKEVSRIQKHLGKKIGSIY